jgi:general secretion pathway protein G
MGLNLRPVVAQILFAAFILIVCLIVVPTFKSKPGQVLYAKEYIVELCQALENFKTDVGRYPTDSEGLTVLLHAPSQLPKWKGPYLDNLRRDPWGRDYVYKIRDSGKCFEVLSWGPDGKPGSKGNISSHNISRDSIFSH